MAEHYWTWGPNKQEGPRWCHSHFRLHQVRLSTPGQVNIYYFSKNNILSENERLTMSPLKSWNFSGKLISGVTPTGGVIGWLTIFLIFWPGFQDSICSPMFVATKFRGAARDIPSPPLVSGISVRALSLRDCMSGLSRGHIHAIYKLAKYEILFDGRTNRFFDTIFQKFQALANILGWFRRFGESGDSRAVVPIRL